VRFGSASLLAFVKTSQVELFGQACQAVRAAQPLEARKTCETDVCGTAAIKVETRPRAVLFLLDASASRIECADGTFDCLVPPGLGIDRTLAFCGRCTRSCRLGCVPSCRFSRA
jgi:hypothetical protein